jgi:hypothetical protein
LTSRVPPIPSSGRCPYTLPLDAATFECALNVGHGRAWQHILGHGSAGVVDLLIHGCLHTLAYDAQCEGDRGQWMLALVDACEGSEAIFERVTRSVHESTVHQSWDVSQRCTLMAELARRGSTDARSALYRLFVAHQTTQHQQGVLEILRLDGVAGLITVCSTLGNTAHQDSTDYIDDYFLSAYSETDGEGEALTALESSNDVGVQHFLERRRGAKRPVPDPQIEKGSPRVATRNVSHRLPNDIRCLSAEDVINWARTTPVPARPSAGWFWLTQWGRKATDSEVEAVCEALEVAEQPTELLRLLRVFSRRKLPHVSDRTVELANHPDSTVRSRAYSALSNVSDARVRDIGLSAIGSGGMANGALELLKSSYLPGDHTVIRAALFLAEDVDDLHGLVSGLVDLCSCAREPDTIDLMMFVYEYSPCGICRARVVDTMRDLKILPDWVAVECQFDAMESLREDFVGLTQPS